MLFRPQRLLNNGFVNIEDINKAELLAALYNNVKQPTDNEYTTLMIDAGFREYELDYARASALIEGGQVFERIEGRLLLVDLSGASFDPTAYDAENGKDTALLATLLAKQGVIERVDLHHMDHILAKGDPELNKLLLSKKDTLLSHTIGLDGLTLS